MFRFRLARRPLAVIVCLLAIAPLSGQTPEENFVRIRFNCLAWEPVEPGIRYASYDEASEPLRLSSEFRSPEYRYEGPPRLTFFREKTGPEGKRLRVPVASTEIDPDLRRALFLFFPLTTEDGSERYRILTIDDSRAAFPPGSYRVFNLTDHPIAGMFGEARLRLEPRDNQLVRPDHESDTNLNIQLAVQNGGEWQRKVSTRWYYRDTARHLVFLARDGERLAIRSIPQYQIPEAENTPDE